MHRFHNRNPLCFHKIWGYIFSNHPCNAFTVASAMKTQFSYYFLLSLNLEKSTKCDKKTLCMSQH